MQQTKSLYGDFVCPQCYYSLLWRRTLAFIIDFAALWFIAPIVLSKLGIVGLNSGGFRVLFDTFYLFPILKSISGIYGPEMAVMCMILLALWFIRDGLKWNFLGKALTGLEVVDKQTGNHANIGDSVTRNLPLLVFLNDFGPIVYTLLTMAFLGSKDGHIGNKWANTRVILKKDQNSSLRQ